VRQALAQGLTVRASDLLPPDPRLAGACDQIQADLLDPAACQQACRGVACVVHAAARQHHSDPPKLGRERFFRQNVEMTRNIADAAEGSDVGQLIFVSSDMVYGLPRHKPFDETDIPHPIGPYGRSKLESERVCCAKRGAGMIVTIFRPRLIVGPGRLGILVRLFDRIRAAKSIPLIGNGANRYQMVSVADVAHAVMLAIERQPNGVYNLGSEDVPSEAELLAGVARRAGSSSGLIPTPARLTKAALWVLHAFRLAPLVPEQFCIAAEDYVLDTSAARRDLGWMPRFNDLEMLWQAYQQYVGGGRAA
jgi:dTDP-glucose 4,6-dehydratase